MNSLTRIGCDTVVAVSCFWLVGVALGQSSPPPKVERPNIKVGDSWTYDRIDGWKKSKEYSFVVTVTSVDDKEIRYESKRSDTGEISTIIRNRDLNRLVTETAAGKAVADPYQPSYSFPLEVGKTWEHKVTHTRSNEPDRKVVVTLTGKVVGWEQVKVPAGTFNSLKIEVNGFFNGSNARGNWNGQVAETTWYVPEMKAAVKSSYQDRNARGGAYADDVWELVAHEPAR